MCTPQVSGMDPCDHHEVISEASAGTVSTPVEYCTAAIMAPSLACVCMVRGKPGFTYATCITLPVSWRHCSNHWNMCLDNTDQHNMYLHAAAPPSQLRVLRVKSMLQSSSCVYSTIIQSQMAPHIQCVLSTSNNVICVDMTTLLRYVTLFDSDVSQKLSRNHLEMETESSLKNVVFSKNRMMDNVQKHNTCIVVHSCLQDRNT
jgi:hypothetical protein